MTMNFKLSIFCLMALLFVSNAQAQIIGGSTEAVVQKNKPVIKAEVSISDAKKTVSDKAVEIQDVVESTEEPAPTAMTPEQKAEIDIEAKKNLNFQLKRQNVRDRKDFIQVMTTNEKIQKRRAALLEGKTEEEAFKAAQEVEAPDINPASDRQMEQYRYQKAGLVDEK